VPSSAFCAQIDVQIGTCHLQDHIEWDLLSPLTPEAFARQLCAELGLSGEAVPLVAHAVHEELLKHTRDAVEWGVLGAAEASGGGADDTPGAGGAGVSVLKDRTGLGLGWGKAPKDGRGRGPKTLKSVWRDWAEAEEFATRFEELTPEEVERRELERERATRYGSLVQQLYFSDPPLDDCAEKRPSFKAEPGEGEDDAMARHSQVGLPREWDFRASLYAQLQKFHNTLLDSSLMGDLLILGPGIVVVFLDDSSALASLVAMLLAEDTTVCVMSRLDVECSFQSDILCRRI
jgi:hypothetical protein